jgi:histidine triad (HIT) family protein
MYNHEPKGYKCPLCQIAKGEMTELGDQESTVFYRDELVTAFVSGKWWRSNPGHVIIIPNQHHENIYDLPNEIGHKILELSKKVSLALKEAYKCEGVSLRQHNEPAGDQEVWHYHLHIYPRYKDDNLYLNHENTFWPTLEEKLPYVEKLKTYFLNS